MLITADSIAHGLREKARQAIAAGELPRGLRASQVLRGVGSGAHCTVCERPISSEHSQIQLQTGFGAGPFLHVDCYNAWRWVSEELRLG